MDNTDKADLALITRQNQRILVELAEIRMEMNSVKLIYNMIEKLQKIVDQATRP